VSYLVIVIAALLAPLVLIALMSFNSSALGTFPFSGTFAWYRALVHESGLLHATLLSLELAAGVAATCAVLGTMLGVWLARYARRFGQVTVNAALVITVTVPWLVLGVAMLLVLNASGVGRSYLGLYLGDAAVALPYTVFIVLARLIGTDPAIEEAAQSLGARPLKVFLRIVLPIAAPAIAAGTLMAFVVCFNNFIIQYFVAPFGVQTLPIDIFGLIRIGYQPDIDALATIITLLTLVPVMILNRLVYGPSSRASHAEVGAPAVG
jgi:spermidine/putrescine transport system permease protein